MARSIGESGGAASSIQADFSNEADVLAVLSSIKAEGELGILISNAGTAYSSPIEMFAAGDFDRLSITRAIRMARCGDDRLWGEGRSFR